MRFRLRGRVSNEQWEKHMSSWSSSWSRVALSLGGVSAAALLAALASPARAETQSYAVSWFAQADYSTDGDCEGGLNPKLPELYAKDLALLGYNSTDIEKLMKGYAGDGDYERGWNPNSVRGLMNMRARINGKPANPYANPAAVADPHLKYVTGKYAYGFDLDGKGASNPMAFEDPETHEKGVENQLFRALGCSDPYRGTLEHDNGFWSFMYMAQKDSTPAWLITLSGDDLSKDGPITITFGHALEPAKFNGNGEPRADMTFRIDPDPQYKGNVYQGEIKNGVISITQQPATLHEQQDQITYPVIDLKRFHVRLKIGPDGTMKGLLGGFQPIDQVYFGLAEGGMAHESNETPELPGTYWLLRKLADADPDPKTGQNWSISATYHITAVPAFAVPADPNDRPAHAVSAPNGQNRRVSGGQ